MGISPLAEQNLAKLFATAELVENLEPRHLMSSGDGASVALIDSSLPDFNALSAAVSSGSKVITYDGRKETASRVIAKLTAWAAATNTKIESLSILSHGSQGRFALGNDYISVADESDPAWTKLRKVMAEKSNIYVFGCNVAAGERDGGHAT